LTDTKSSSTIVKSEMKKATTTTPAKTQRKYNDAFKQKALSIFSRPT